MTARSYIHVLLPEQRLRLIDERERVRMDVAVSTAANGAGELINSNCTPRGWHVVRARIGAHATINTVFIGRRPSGEVYSARLRAREPQRDWILTRILWLSGLERGRNRLGDVDTMRRYIYIHGAPDDVPMGCVGSHGCVRMRNADIIELFECVDVGTRVLISDDRQ
jgi:lipoprotein-anchoring transpeptidase ErfK/SrfK